MKRASKRAILMWTFNVFGKTLYLVILGAFVFSIILYLAFANGNNWPAAKNVTGYIVLALAVVILVLLIMSFFNAFFIYLSRGYELGPEALKIVEGIISQRESFIPYQNIENIDLRITAAEAIWGLADIMIFTSSVGDKENPDSAEGYISGLKYGEATALKDELLKRIKS